MTTADPVDVLDRFRRAHALLDGHFRLTSGLHSSGYLQCALVLQHPREAEALGAAIADRVRSLGVQTVLSPALGGIVIGQEVGRALGVRAIFAERQDGRLALRRGFTLERGEQVLVVEDVVTTGGSTRETIDLARWAATSSPRRRSSIAVEDSRKSTCRSTCSQRCRCLLTIPRPARCAWLGCR
jgi:orotate phosphoribosyltransferase